MVYNININVPNTIKGRTIKVLVVHRNGTKRGVVLTEMPAPRGVSVITVEVPDYIVHNHTIKVHVVKQNGKITGTYIEDEQSNASPEGSSGDGKRKHTGGTKKHKGTKKHRGTKKMGV